MPRPTKRARGAIIEDQSSSDEQTNPSVAAQLSEDEEVKYSSKEPSPEPISPPSDLTFLYDEPTLRPLKTYELSNPLRSHITETQKLLKETAVIFENIRVLYSNDEDKNISEELIETIEPNKEQEEKYSKYIQGLDSIFKTTLDVSLKSQLLKSSVASTLDYGRQYALGNNVNIDIENIDEMTQAKPLHEILKEKYQDLVNQSQQLPQAEKLSESYLSQPYSQFRKSIFEVNHADEEMPPIETYYDDRNSDDEDLVESRAVVSYKCPLTKQYFVHPVTSTKCGHSFSKAAIMEVIEINHGLVKCPVSACKYQCMRSYFKDDPDLAAKANARKERELKQAQRRNDNLETL